MGTISFKKEQILGLKELKMDSGVSNLASVHVRAWIQKIFLCTVRLGLFLKCLIASFLLLPVLGRSSLKKQKRKYGLCSNFSRPPRVWTTKKNHLFIKRFKYPIYVEYILVIYGVPPRKPIPSIQTYYNSISLSLPELH